MHVRTICISIAVLGLAACGEDQTTARNTAPATPTTPPPATTATAPTTAPPASTPTTTAGADTRTTAPASGSAGTAGGTSSPASSATAPTASQDRAATTGALAAPGSLRPGQYRAEQVTLRVEEGGNFTMTEKDGSREIRGRYTYANGTLSLMDPTGDTGKTEFPIRCGVERSGEGFKLVQAEAAPCRVLKDSAFKPAA